MAEQQRWFSEHPEAGYFGLSLASDTESYAGHVNKASRGVKSVGTRETGARCDMKTLLNARDQEEIRARLGAIGPGSSRRWGQMSVGQMVCHLSDGYRLYMGLRKVSTINFPYPRIVVKWVALWAPVPWPKGFQTAREMDQQGGGGTPPVDFENDLRELRNLIERFVRRPADFRWPVHPHFGVMSEKEWMRLGYLHADHHLRQFGA